jgi:hypothetical protein
LKPFKLIDDKTFLWHQFWALQSCI